MTRFLVDGQDLDDAEGRWIVDYGAALPGVAERDVATLRLPSRSTSITKRLGWGEGAFKVVVTVPPSGSLRGGLPVESVGERVRALTALLARAEVLTVSEGTTVRSVAIVSASVSDPSRVGVEAWRISAVFTLQPFWVGVVDYLDAVPLTVVVEGSDVFVEGDYALAGAGPGETYMSVMGGTVDAGVAGMLESHEFSADDLEVE